MTMEPFEAAVIDELGNIKGDDAGEGNAGRKIERLLSDFATSVRNDW